MQIRLITAIFVLVIGISNLQAQVLPNRHQIAQLPSAKTIRGDKVTRTWLQGKPLVITFFASWCPPCRNEFKQLNALKKHPQGKSANIVAINVFENYGGKNPARLKRFLESTKPDFSIIEGSPLMRKAFGNVTRIPTLVVYDRSGKEIWRFIHQRGATKMSAELDEIVTALKKVTK